MKTKNLHFRKAVSVAFILNLTVVIGMAQINPRFKSSDRFLVDFNEYKGRVKENNRYSFPEKSKMFEPATTYWKSRGYGLLATIANDSILLYASTQISTIPAVMLLMMDNYLYNEDALPIGYEYRDTTFVMKLGTEIVFDEIDTLPVVQYSGFTDNPVVNFEVLWETYKENCPLFELTHTNWDSIYSVYSPLVTETTGDEELFSIFCEMLAPLHDGHTFIYNPFEDWYYTPGPGVDYFWVRDWELLLENTQFRLDGQEFNVRANGVVLYGKIDGNIGYICVGSMGGFSSYEEFTPDEEIISQVMDDLIDEFADCKAIIVDIRLNGGGNPAVSMEIISKFNDQARIGYWYDYRDGGYDEYSDRVPVYTYTSEKNFGNKPVIVLTSKYSMSAADEFAMVIRDIPTVTLVGEHTYGIFSLYLGLTLPNQWDIGYTMQRLFSSEMINYEQIGIYPDVEIAPDSVDFYSGTDNVLEKAIGILNPVSIDPVKVNPVTMRVHSNPFKEHATIEVTMPEDEAGELTIVDMTGRVLVSYEVQGIKTIEWNADGYNEGIYFCVLKTRNSSECLKLMHIR